MKLIKPNAQPTTLAGFSRASTATYIDDAGVLQTAGVDVPRFQGGQLLVEGQGTNQCWPSRIPTTTTSTTYGRVNINGATQIVAGAVGIDGTANAFTVSGANSWANSTGENNIRISYSLPSGGVLTFSAWVRTSGATPAQVGIRFNILEGGSGQTQVTTAQWVRISRTATVSASGTVILASTGGTPWEMDGLQVEYGPLSSYIPTTTAAATREADVITGSGLLSTTATDATPAYSAGTTYLAGVQVHYNRVRYESLQSGNTGRTPDVNPAWWGRLGPVNQWAMFDDQVSTQTVQAAGPLRVALQTGAMDSLAVLGVDADRVRLVVQDGAGGSVVYDQEQGMAAEAVTNWFDYFFNDPMYRRTQALFSSIPPFGSSVATLTFASGSPVRVGHVSYGRVRSLGGLRYGARAGIKDFSRKDTDDFGNTTFVRRANSKYLTGTLEVEKFEINQVHNLLTSLTATPVVWIGSDDAYYSDTLLVFGFFRDFYCSIDYPTLAIYSIEIEGLI